MQAAAAAAVPPAGGGAGLPARPIRFIVPLRPAAD
jgi:hypothetical protein